MTKCITCNNFNESCDFNKPTVHIFGVGTVSVTQIQVSGSGNDVESDCISFTPYVDDVSLDIRGYKDIMRTKHRRDLKKRHDIGFKKHVKPCAFCRYNVCRCKTRRTPV